MKICPNCGKSIQNRAVICPKCYAKLTEQNQPLSTQAISNTGKITSNKTFSVIKTIILWCIFAAFAFTGLAGMIAGAFVPALFFILIALIFNPLIIKAITPKIKFFNKAWFRIVAVVVCFVLISVTMPPIDTSTVAPVSSSKAESKKEVSSTVSEVKSSAPVSSSKESPSSAASSKEPIDKVIKISAADLLTAYDENGVKADEDYKNKMLEVTGIIKNIDKDIFDDIYVSLGADDSYEFINVRCYFSGKESSSVAKLKKDDEVTIIGKCDGSSIDVSMKKCTIK